MLHCPPRKRRQQMSENEIIPIDDAPETVRAETAQEKFERERLSRRQALKKFGMNSAVAAFAMFSVDDLARMVGKAMERRSRDNKVAAQIAQELRQAGIAFAGGPSWLNCGVCNTNCTPGLYQYCEPCAWPCTGSILRDESCRDFSYAKCQACCASRNPPPSGGNTGLPNVGYNNCVSAGGCV